MYNFNFYNPTKIIFGKDRFSELDSLISKDQRVLITYGGGSAVKSGLIERIKKALGDRIVFEFGGIEPNPRYETLMKAVQVVRNEKIDFILAIGGGSVIDGTKFIVLASGYPGEGHELLNFGFKAIGDDTVANVIPFGAVLTLPAAGSEMNNGAVITYNAGKRVVKGERTYPKFSFLDPKLTFTLPKTQVANGIVDAYIHTMEQYLTFPADARVQDRMAEGILQTLIEIGETNLGDNDDYDSRANLVWSATMALNGIIGAGVPQDWTTHMIGHELTAMFGIDHGQTLAIIYPAVMKVRREQKRAKLLQYAERVWNITAGSEDERISAVTAKTREFFESLGVKTRMSEYGISKDKIPALIEQLKAHGMLNLSETGDITLEISRQILEEAL